MVKMSNEDAADYRSWLRLLDVGLDRHRAAVKRIADAQPIVDEKVTRYLAGLLRRSEKWLDRAKEIHRAPEEYVADPAQGQGTRAVELYVTQVGQWVDLAEDAAELVAT